MDANILKTAISSIVYVASEDIQKINAFDPTKKDAYDLSYLFSIANLARNVSKAYKGIESLIQTHAADIAKIDKETMNNLISVATSLAKALKNLIDENPSEFMKYIDFDSIVKDDDPGAAYSAITAAADMLEKREKEDTVCSQE